MKFTKRQCWCSHSNTLAPQFFSEPTFSLASFHLFVSVFSNVTINTIEKTILSKWQNLDMHTLDHRQRLTDTVWCQVIYSYILQFEIIEMLHLTYKGRVLVDLWPLWEELLCLEFYQVPPLHHLHRMVLWNCHPHLHASPSHNPEGRQQRWFSKFWSIDKCLGWTCNILQIRLITHTLRLLRPLPPRYSQYK